MAVPQTLLWDQDPHTEAKHRVLAGYYDAWYPIMLSQWPRLTIFEGYSGPGEHTRGEEGSPIIAIRRLVERPELLRLRKPIRFVFVEEREDRLEHLKDLIGEKFPNLPGHLKVELVCGTCEDEWEGALNRANAWRQPIFANLDPFGPGVPCDLVRALGKNKGSEVLVTFMSDWLRRFATLEDVDGGDRQFGSKRWRKVADLDDPEQKELFLVNEYRETLVAAGLNLNARFRLSDEGGRSFYLIYGTGHRTGLERMKAAMWKVDPVTGTRFRDPKDPAQGVLDFGVPEPDLAPLVRQIQQKLQAGPTGSATLGELRDFALLETAFRPPHATKAVGQMIESGYLRRDPERGRLSMAVHLHLR